MKVKKPITLYRGESTNSYSNKFKPLAGIFFSPNLKGAKGWGTVVKYTLSPDANIFKYKSSGSYIADNNFNNKEYSEVHELAKSLGLDFKSMEEFDNNFDYYRENGLEDRLAKNNKNAVGYDVYDWISQIVSRVELEKNGYDGVKWELEDFGNPNQFQIWNMDVIDKINEHLKEDQRKNVHQTHMESLLTLGENGINELNNYINNFLNRFKGEEKLILTSKIDGAPALTIWSHIGNGYPDNSIALKSFNTGPSTAMSTPEEIDKKYGDRPDMAEKLKQGLKLAKYIPAGEAWQGDCLFTKNDLKEEDINGISYITFQPNKIVYAFSEDNVGYNDVKNADFGIAFHTIYTINNDGDKSQSFNVDLSKINTPNNFYLLSPAINVSKEKSDYDYDNIINEYNNLKQLEQKLLSDKNYNELVNNKSFIDYWNMFENYSLADKKQVNINVNTLLKDLKDYILNKKEKEYNKKVGSLKTDQGKEKAKEKYDKDLLELEDLLNNNKDTITNLVNAINSAANIKMKLLQGFNKAKDDYSTFYKSRTKGYIPANREGIAMSDEDGNIVKIVDRSEFSSNNRNADYMAGFEHESLQEDINNLDISIKPILKNELKEKEKDFIKTLVKIILDGEYSKYFNNGIYDESKLKRKYAHKFWLDNFGLDTSLKGIGSAIDNALVQIDSALEDEEEYKDTLDWDDADKLSEEEQFKINLYYDWDVNVKKNTWGEYEEDDPIRKLTFKEYLKHLLDTNEYSGQEKEWLEKAIKEYDIKENITQRINMKSFNKEVITMNDENGNIVKIVDKLEFSSNNRNEHESLQEDAIKDLSKKEIADLFKKLNKIHYGAGGNCGNLALAVMREIPNKNKKLVICSNDWFDGDPDDYLELDVYHVALLVDNNLFDFSGDITVDDLVNLCYDEYGDGDPRIRVWTFNSPNDDETFRRVFEWSTNYDVAPEFYQKHIKKLLNKKEESFGVATQGVDMGSFKSFTKNINEDTNKTAVVGVGKLNPPTIGHKKLVDSLVEIGNKYGVKPKLLLTHTENPLSYVSKLKWVNKAFGDKIDVDNTNARTPFQYLQELYNDGYTDIVYVGGSDRIGGSEDITKQILAYNGKNDKNGNLVYNFNSIKFENIGNRADDGDDIISRTSSTLARKLVKDNNFEEFKDIVPFNENDAMRLYKELQYAMKG